MPARKSPARDDVDAALLRDVEDSIRGAGALPLKKLTREKLTPRAHEELAQQLAARGLERTAKVIRIPLPEQILAVMDAGARVPLREVPKRVKGASSQAETRASLEGLCKAGRLRVVVRTEAEVLVQGGERVVDAAEIARLAKLHVALGKTLKKLSARGRPRDWLREDAASLLEPLAAIARPTGASTPRPPAPRELLAAAIARHEDPRLGLARVPDLVRALAGRLSTAEAHGVLEDAVHAGWLELRPEAGSEYLPPEEAALCPPGPRGTVLYFARRIGDGT